MTELLPCPFCGGKPIQYFSSEADQVGHIYCPNDDCFGPATSNAAIRDAAMMWNRRAVGSAQCEQPNAGKFLSVALQVIHACNGDPKRADEAAHVIAVAACSTPADGEEPRDRAFEAYRGAMQRKVESLESAVDLLERNAGIQAKLLADTARERDFYKQESSERQQQICETNDRLMVALGQVERLAAYLDSPTAQAAAQQAILKHPYWSVHGPAAAYGFAGSALKAVRASIPSTVGQPK